MHPAQKRITTHGVGTSKDSQVWEVYYGPRIVPLPKRLLPRPMDRLFHPKFIFKNTIQFTAKSGWQIFPNLPDLPCFWPCFPCRLDLRTNRIWHFFVHQTTRKRFGPGRAVVFQETSGGKWNMGWIQADHWNQKSLRLFLVLMRFRWFTIIHRFFVCRCFSVCH